jgi:hypothetical protein
MLTYVFLENRVVYEIMSKNKVEPEEPQITSQYGAYELHVSYASLHTCMRMQTPTRLGTRTRAHKYVIRISFSPQQWFTNTLQYYVMRTLSALFSFCRI